MILTAPALRSSIEFGTGSHTAGTKVALTSGTRSSFLQTSNPNRAIGFSTSIDEVARRPGNPTQGLSPSSSLRNHRVSLLVSAYVSFIVWTQTASSKPERLEDVEKGFA